MRVNNKGGIMGLEGALRGLAENLPKNDRESGQVETAVRLQWDDVEELAAYLLGLGDDYETDEVESGLYEKYEISPEAFHEIVENLLPLVDLGESPLSGKWYRGFSKPVNEKARAWLLKMGCDHEY